MGRGGPVPSGLPAQCAAVLEPPEPACFDSDVGEPNDRSNPVELVLGASCGYVEANLTQAETDGYKFTVERADPVAIELAYLADGETDLDIAVTNVSSGNVVGEESRSRSTPREDIVLMLQPAAGATYAVRVVDSSNAETCQSYALRVDPSYCTDAREDDDELAQATKLVWDENETVTLQGTLFDEDKDFFELTTERADPVLITGSYVADPDSTIQVQRRVYDAAGTLKLDKGGARKTPTESFEHWVLAPAKGSTLRAALVPSGSGCATYEVTFDAAACSDKFEDNDAMAEAKPMPLGVDVAATIMSGDEDHYTLPSPLAAGSCTLRYEIPGGEAQDIRLRGYNGAGTLTLDSNGGVLEGTTRTLHKTWSDTQVATIQVAADGDFCQPYTIRCDPPAGQ